MNSRKPCDALLLSDDFFQFMAIKIQKYGYLLSKRLSVSVTAVELFCCSHLLHAEFALALVVTQI
jgi:hypothetical protein